MIRLALALSLIAAPVAAKPLPVTFKDMMSFGMLEAVKERQELNDAFGISTSPYELSNEGGLSLTWTSPSGRVATARAEIIGSFSEESSSFLWAWANDTVPDALRPTATNLRDHAATHNIEMMLSPIVPANLAYAERLAAIATLAEGVEGIFGIDWTGGQVIFLGLHDVEVSQP